MPDMGTQIRQNIFCQGNRSFIRELQGAIHESGLSSTYDKDASNMRSAFLHELSLTSPEIFSNMPTRWSERSLLELWFVAPTMNVSSRSSIWA